MQLSKQEITTITIFPKIAVEFLTCDNLVAHVTTLQNHLHMCANGAWAQMKSSEGHPMVKPIVPRGNGSLW